MIYKVRFGNGNHIVSRSLYVHKSEWKGSGDIEFKNNDTIWLGSNHFTAPSISIQVSCITGVELRSSLDEDDEPWEDVWTIGEPWSYLRDHKLEKLLEGLK